jgi:Holliday junction resolvase RusA-like endonuclease
MRAEFFMPMVPPKVTAQQQKTRVIKGKPFRYDPPEVTAAKSKITAHLGAHVPEVPFTGPLRVVLKLCWPIEGTSHHDGEWHVDKPDFDNAAKIPIDCMKRLRFFNRDDCQIASGIVEKFWADVPGIFVSIEELT